jgi:hypothetical protein|tara:strand:- start:188 stop:832 length:645 start_codon:yes stop_codon:yes gene_type:complete
MNNKVVFFIGILGVSLFAIPSIIGGFLIEDYNLISQWISESDASDTKYGLALRIFGYIPSGFLIAIFCFVGFKKFQPSKLTKVGFYGLGVFYGIATIITGIFPCDVDCNKNFIDPSISQIIHNLAALLTYIFVPISVMIVGLGLRRSPSHNRLSVIAITCGIISSLFVSLLLADLSSQYVGLLQRIIESIFLIWIITCAIEIKNMTTKNGSPSG